jgi:hypothetical protein
VQFAKLWEMLHGVHWIQVCRILFLGSSLAMDHTPPKRPTTCNYWVKRNLLFPPWFGSLEHHRNASSTFGWSLKIECGRIGSKKENGQIVVRASYVIKCKKPPPTFFSNAVSPSEYGPKLSLGLG